MVLKNLNNSRNTTKCNLAASRKNLNVLQLEVQTKIINV